MTKEIFVVTKVEKNHRQNVATYQIMSQHKARLKGKKLCRDKEILYRDIFQEQQGMTSMLQQSFYVMTQDSYVATITRQL